MAEQLFEDLIAVGLPKDVNTNQWLQEKFQQSSATCTVEDFAAFYFSLVKTQTDEFIKYNTSTCNTPRKMTLVGVGENAFDSPMLPLTNDKSFNEKEPTFQPRATPTPIETRTNKRQSSRELFASQNENFPSLKASEAQQVDSPIFNSRKSGPFDSSTPVTNSSINRSIVQSFNRSIDDTPTITSTPQSYRNKNSFSLNDQSSLTFRNSPRNNSLDLSSKNNSNRRNTSSPMCLGDFLNVSAVSSSGKGNKKKNTSQEKPNFSNSDFPVLGEEPRVEVKKTESKPKKRVVPITISRKSTSETSNFISSSFQMDNNLLNVDEGIDILSQRKMLRDQRDVISKDFTEPQRNLHAIVKENLQVVAQSPRKTATFQFDGSKVEKKDVLLSMAQFYSFLLDMNLVSNILTEYSYLFSLLNTEHDPFEHVKHEIDSKSPINVASSLLKNLHNCVFFTAHILNCQKQNLSLLDAITIRVILDNERVSQLAVELFDHLRSTLKQKSQFDATIAKLTRNIGNNVDKKVFFQQEDDNRDNFPSDREFLAFKKQRDTFYSILNSWELRHLDPVYDFRKDLGMKIRSLITMMEHPINMAHLAKLFTAQLIISCDFSNSTNELQMALPGIDLSKLSKLRQRLVAPSTFSTQYLFPGIQAFFRDFIVCSDQHVIFMEQLKISLISELMQINDSSMEVLCITSGNDDLNKEQSFREEFIVRAETMTTMRVLAKFVGFVVSRPYTFDGYRNPLVDQKQMQIRNLLHPAFDVKTVVLRAIDGSKLLVTIPWLVEYLAMLDFITIRLDYYRELFQLLYTVYMKVNIVNDRGSLCVMPTSKFIIRACLGWLFEHPEIPEDYYNLNNKTVALKAIENVTPVVAQLNPYLETILNAACPFLADFRVSMMPQRTTKAVSRTGRYRHITTKFQDKAVAQQTKVQDNKERLIQAFLAHQTVSVRKIVEFTIDRVASAVVKDFQVKHLLTTRKEAKLEVEQLLPSINNSDALVKKMIEVFQEHLKQLQSQWIEASAENCKARVVSAFDTFLPIETLEDVKKTLVNITIDKTSEKLHEWRSTNLNTIEIFSKDIQADAVKMKENHQQNGNKRTTASIAIDLSAKTLPSDYFKELQLLLHTVSLHSNRLDGTETMKCIEMAQDVLEKQILPSNAYRNIAFYTLQLVLQIIVNRVDLITKQLLMKTYTLWRHEKLLPFTSPDLQSDEITQNRIKVDNFVFSNVISARLLLIMQGKSRINFEVLGNFLVELVRENFITADHINEQSVRLYKQEWPPQSLADIAFLLQHIKNSLSTTASSESQLFLELVGDLARDMENF